MSYLKKKLANILQHPLHDMPQWYIFTLIVFVYIRELPYICFLPSHSETLWYKRLYYLFYCHVQVQEAWEKYIWYFSRPQCRGVNPFRSTDTGESHTSFAVVAESWVFTAWAGCRCSLMDNRIPKDRSRGFIWKKWVWLDMTLGVC